MRKRLLITIVIVGLIMASSCSNKNNTIELKSGKYVEIENGLAWVILKENNKFEFNRGITSYRPEGCYILKEGQLILKVNELEEYKFKIEGEKLVFESGTHIGDLIKKGVVFQFSDKDIK